MVRNPAAGSPKRYLLGARLSPDGEVLDRDPIVISSTFSGAPSVVWNGSDYLVLPQFETYSGVDPSRGEAWLVSPEGSARGPVAQPVERNARGESLAIESEVFGRWSSFVAVGEDGARTRLLTVSTFNRLIPYAMFPVGDGWGALTTEIGRVRWFNINGDGTHNSSVFGSYTEILSIARHDNDLAFSWRTQSAGVLEVGYNVIDVRTGGARIEVLRRFSPYTDSGIRPAVAYSGADLMVAWAERETTPGGRNSVVVKSGGITRTVATYDSMTFVTPLLAAGARNLVAWNVRGLGPCCFQTFVRTFADAGELDDGRVPQPVRQGPAMQSNPRAAAGANGLFATWLENAPAPQIKASFHPTAGSPSEPVAVSESGQFISHNVAANSDTYVIAWSEFDYEFKPSGVLDTAELRILVRRYDAAGIALDASPLLVSRIASPSSGSTGVSVIADGSSFVIAWLGEGQKLYATRMPSRGGAAFPAVLLSADNLPVPAAPALVRLGGRITVVYEVDSGPITRRIEAARLDDHLNVEARETLWDINRVNFNEIMENADINSLDAAASGDQLLLAWSERTEDPNAGYHCLYTRRFTASLVPIEPPRVNVCNVDAGWESNRNYRPSVAWDGKRWWVTANGFNLVPVLAWLNNRKERQIGRIRGC